MYKIFNKINSYIQKQLKKTTYMIIYCPKCKSPHVSYSKSTVRKTDEWIMESYDVKCMDCNAYGFFEEYWKINNE